MTGTQTLKIYEILQRHFKNEADAKTVVQELETVIDNKFADKKETLATKEDISSLKQDVLKFQVDVEKRLNQMIIWIVTTGVAVVGLIFAIIKLK